MYVHLLVYIRIRIAITFKSIEDWGKLMFEQQLTRAEL
jgi:hypothetical protein